MGVVGNAGAAVDGGRGRLGAEGGVAGVGVAREDEVEVFLRGELSADAADEREGEVFLEDAVADAGAVVWATVGGVEDEVVVAVGAGVRGGGRGGCGLLGGLGRGLGRKQEGGREEA